MILLTTNLLKKELRGAVGGGMHGVYEAGLAVNCISNIVTDDLARDLLPEITNLTAHPQPYLRKKAVLCLFKVFVRYPQGLRLTFAKIQQCVQDPDSSVVSCAVNVITELSDKNPKNYLPLAPAFFDLLTQSSNNWMLIKVVKLLGSLVPEEPRLARKLLEPLANIVRSTKAKSLLYEAIHTITLCLPYCRKNDGSMPATVPEIVMLCAQTLRDFVEQADQNLKYLGLVGFGSLMQSHPRVLSAPDYRPLILECLSDQDVTIRSRALDLLTGMASRKNLMELVTQLLQHVELATGSYKHDLVAKIIEMCSGDKYALLQDFAWYLDILFRIGHMRGVERHGDMLRAQVTDVALRVLPVRPYAVRRSIEILLEGEGSVSDDPYGDNGRGKHIMSDILPALAWIIGEYSDLIREAIDYQENGDHGDEEEEFFYDEDSAGSYHAIIQALTDPSKSQNQPSSTQKVYVQATIKVLAVASSDNRVSDAELGFCVEAVHSGLSIYVQSPNSEVAERSFVALELLKSLDVVPESANGPPAMTVVSDDDSAGGDLLGIEGGAKASKVSVPKTTVRGSVAARLRVASTTLCYLLKPAPMKPIGAKIQKKKSESVLGGAIDVEKPMDLSVFRDFLEDEIRYREKEKLTIDSVSFSQQQPQKPETRPSLVTSSPHTQGNLLPSIGATDNTSFQHPSSSLQPAAAQRPRQSDPFYLHSGPTDSAEEGPAPNRFGTIELVDSDEEHERPKKTKKRKEKKAKRSKQHESQLIPGFDPPQPTPATSDSFEVYDSDDDGEDIMRGSAVPTGNRLKKKAHGKEFADLAQVDLTTPLREDEVMPERRHRVVPERSVEQALVSSKSRRKSKKSKKAKASKTQAAPVGDLLDLGGFGDTTSGSGDAGTTLPPPTSTNPISSAFDDLLGMTMPAAPVLVPPAAGSAAPSSLTQSPSKEAPPPSGKLPKRLWMKATIKSSSAPNSPVDWSSVLVKYRMHRKSRENPLDLSLSFCVANQSTVAIPNLSLSFKDIDPLILGTIGPGASVETAKVGFFSFPRSDDSLGIKGFLETPGGSVGIKLVLPAWLHLSPEANLSLESVAAELSAPDWSSYSAKIDSPYGATNHEVQQALSKFLRSGEVSGSADDSTAGTFASRSSSGARVRFLLKVKERSVKVDVKATSASLAKALASDIKRIML